MTFTKTFTILGVLALILTFSFIEASPLFLFRATGKDTGKLREAIEEFIEASKLHDLEVVAHDNEDIFISLEPPAQSVAGQISETDDDIDAVSSFAPSSRALFQFLRDQNVDLKLLGRHGFIPKALLPRRHAAFNNKVPEGYTSPSEMRAIFSKIAEKNSFAEWIDIAKQFNNGTSIEGRPIHALRLNYKPRAGKPAVLFASCHHARELITPEIAIALGTVFTEGFAAQNKQILQWLEEYDIWIIPVLNVDGHEFVWKSNNMWRKNRRPLEGGNFGVDLNRNYDLGWDTQGGSADSSTEIYRGAAPFSEPETQALKKLSEAMRFVKVMDFHSSGREVLTHYARLPMPSIMKEFIAAEGKKLAKLAKYGTRVPSDDGEHQEWQIKVNTAYSFLVETGTSFQPEFSEARKETRRVWPLVKSFLNRPISVKGIVIDASGKPVPNAEISISGIKWELGESRHTQETGHFNLFLPQGEYKIQFSAPNIGKKTVEVSVKDDTSQTVNIQL